MLWLSVASLSFWVSLSCLHPAWRLKPKRSLNDQTSVSYPAGSNVISLHQPTLPHTWALWGRHGFLFSYRHTPNRYLSGTPIFPFVNQTHRTNRGCRGILAWCRHNRQCFPVCRDVCRLVHVLDRSNCAHRGIFDCAGNCAFLGKMAT